MNNAGISRSTFEVEKGKESAEALSKELFNDSWEEWEEIYRTNVIRLVSPLCLLPIKSFRDVV